MIGLHGSVADSDGISETRGVKVKKKKKKKDVLSEGMLRVMVLLTKAAPPLIFKWNFEIND